MRALLQRVSRAAVSVDGAVIGQTGRGLLILLGITHTDDEAAAAYLAERCATLRIFPDDDGKMNRSLLDIGGSTLTVSQFTLYGDTTRGRRPSYTAAAAPEPAEKLYECFVAHLRALGVPTETGRFGADMQLEIHNDGPVTLLLESKE